MDANTPRPVVKQSPAASTKQNTTVKLLTIKTSTGTSCFVIPAPVMLFFSLVIIVFICTLKTLVASLKPNTCTSIRKKVFLKKVSLKIQNKFCFFIGKCKQSEFSHTHRVSNCLNHCSQGSMEQSYFNRTNWHHSNTEADHRGAPT